MLSEMDHNKIIRKAANSVLKPNGLFQKGTSRVWIDDNGWYFIVVEFQPSNWDKGTYLNVAVHFLWDEMDYLSFDYCINDASASRISKFVSFDGNEERFWGEVHSLAEAAMTKVEQYRMLRDLKYARSAILKHHCPHKVHTLYQKMMICGLRCDPDAVAYFEELLYELSVTSAKWTAKYRCELTDQVAPIIHSPQLFYNYILEKIEHQRAFWNSKPSMKKMKKIFVIES